MQTTMEYSPLEDARAQLNGAKVAAPLVAAVLSTHGITDDAAFTEATTKLGTALQDTVDKVLQVVAPNHSSAALNASTAAALSPLLADAWKLNPNQDSYEHVSTAFLNLVRFTKPDPGRVFNDDMPRATSEALAEARAASKIFPTLFRLKKLPPATRSLYLSERTLEEFQTRCRKEICCMAQEVVWQLDFENEKQKSMVYSSALDCISGVYAEALADSYSSLKQKLVHLKNSTPEDRKTFLQHARACPDGLLFESFPQDVRIITTQLLYPSESKADLSPEL